MHPSQILKDLSDAMGRGFDEARKATSDPEEKWAQMATPLAVLLRVSRSLAAYIEAQEARIKALEEAPLEYLGTHEIGRSYAKNAVVTHDGSMWVARRTTTQAPGPGDGWQLCVKRGRDAR